MRFLAVLFALQISTPVLSAPKEAWSLATDIDTPESAYFDAKSGDIFVSNIAGDPTKKDGVGWISRLSTDGKVKAAKWVEGLDAPKGLRSSGDILWVADVDRLLGISIKSAKIVE